MSSKRKLERQKKKKAEKEMQQALGLFDKIPDKCLTCESEFDKTNKEMVASWRVVVQKAKETVRLYCPACWETAIKIVKEYNEKGKEQ